MAGKGGKRAGAGRKSDAELDAVRALMDAVIPDARKKKIILALAKRCESGDVRAIALWLSYRYGNPPQVTKVEGVPDGEPIQFITVAPK